MVKFLRFRRLSVSLTSLSSSPTTLSQSLWLILLKEAENKTRTILNSAPREAFLRSTRDKFSKLSHIIDQSVLDIAMVLWVIWALMAHLPTIAPSITQLSTQVCLKVPTRAWDTCLSFPVTHMVKAFRCTNMFPQRALTQVTPTHTSSAIMPIRCSSPSTISRRLPFMDTTPWCIPISSPENKVSIGLSTKLVTPKQIESNQAVLMIYLRLSRNASRRQGDIAFVNKMISYITSPVVYLVI